MKISFLFFFLSLTSQLSQIIAIHHICLLGLTGLKSNTIFISHDIIQSISKIDKTASFTILTRDLMKGNQSFISFCNEMALVFPCVHWLRGFDP